MQICCAGKEIRENIFSEVKHLLHDLDAGMLPISVFFPYLPIPKHNARDRSVLQSDKKGAKLVLYFSNLREAALSDR